jgi:pimeloyl-ACP methyl ester carboxylesterase
MRHGMADIEPGLRLHHVSSGEGERTVVLLHGFPQTWLEWRPAGGYDKRTMAGDIHRLLHEHPGVYGPVVVAGHDIGLMVAYSYAQAYRDDVSHLVVMDAPLPGTTVFDRLRSDPRVWHFAFHGARDIPEALVDGLLEFLG